MDTNTLKAWQSAKIMKGLYPGMNYLARLRGRMDKCFPPNDPLFRLVVDAYDATRRLNIEMHYQSCKSGVGRPAKES